MQIESETDPGPPPGDDGGFEAAYHRHRDRLRRLAYLMTGRAEVAEELVHDAFVRLHGRWDEVDVPPAYLRTVVVRLCLDWRRQAAMGQERELRLVPTTRTTADPPEVDETAAVAAALAAVQLAGGDDGTTRAATPAQEGPAPSPPPTDAGVPDWHGRGPALVAGYERAGVPPDQYHWLWMTWYPDPDMASQPPPGPHEDLSVDGRPARLEWYTNEVLVQDVLVFYDDGVLGLTSGDLTRDEVLAMAATIHRDGDTVAFAATPPADWVFTESRPGAVFTHDDALAAEAARLKDELGSWLDATTTVPAG